MAAHLEARIWAVMGASGSGKGAWIKGQLRHELDTSRLIVWDFMDEYGEFATKVPTLAGLLKKMVAAGADGKLRARYVPRGTTPKAVKAEFEALCEMVYAWGSCIFIPEELSNVTTPSWAPAAWRKMTTSGRHCGVHIIGTSQTPAMIDKAFLGNCNLIHVGPLRERNHRRAVALSMDIPETQVAELTKLHWIEKDHDTGEVRQGIVNPKTGKNTTQNAPPAFAEAAARAATRRSPSPTPRGAASHRQAPPGRKKVSPS